MKTFGLYVRNISAFQPFISLFMQKLKVYSSVLGRIYDVKYVIGIWPLHIFIVLGVNWTDVLLQTKVTTALFFQSIICNKILGDLVAYKFHSVLYWLHFCF